MKKKDKAEQKESPIVIPEVDFDKIITDKIDFDTDFYCEIKEPVVDKDFYLYDKKETISEQSKEAVGVILQEIREREKKYREELNWELDAQYYVSIVFNSSKERNEFVKKHNIKLEFDDHFVYDKHKDIFKDK